MEAQQSKPEHASDSHASYGRLIQDHIMNLEAFRDVVEIAETLDDDREARAQELLRSLPRFTDPQKRAALRQAIAAFADVMIEFAQDATEATEAPQQGGVPTEQIRSHETRTVEVAAHEDEEAKKKDEEAKKKEDTVEQAFHLAVGRNEAGITHASISLPDSDVAALFGAYFMELALFVGSPPRGQVVMTSLLTAVVGSFDALVGELATRFFRHRPAALGDQPEFSLEDLASFETLDDAREELIQRKVDAMDRGLDEQVKWFKSRLNIELPRLALDWERFVEITQRRHLIVHTGGRVSRRYLARAPIDSGARIGDSLTVDGEYMRTAVDEVLALGVNLIVAVWVNVVNDHEGAAGALLSATRRAARDNHWAVVRRFVSVSERLRVAQSARSAFEVLGWLATKHLDGPAAVRIDVESWDDSALSRKWQLAKHCLLDHVDEAVKLASSLVEAGEISAAALIMDPLYKDLLSDELVTALIRTSGLSNTADPLDDEPRDP
jgi:hypothetical protein